MVSVLSTGPVGPGDSVNGTDKNIVLPTCSKEGRLLKPGTPAKSIDDFYFTQSDLSNTLKGHVWSAYSLISGYTFYNILSFKMEEEYKLYPSK